jgi:hypothetical protein
MFMQHFMHGLGMESAEYLDMTSGGVFVHCMVEEGKLISDRILSVTPLEDMQFKGPLIFEDELIITFLDTSDISTLPGKEELLQLTAPGIGSENEIEDATPFPLSIEEDCFDDDIGNSSKAPACDLWVSNSNLLNKIWRNSWFPRRIASNCVTPAFYNNQILSN